MADWFVSKNGKEHGPFSDAQLRKLAATGKLHGEDLVRPGQSNTFRKANQIKGLFTETAVPNLPAVNPSPPSPNVPPPPSAEPIDAQVEEKPWYKREELPPFFRSKTARTIAFGVLLYGSVRGCTQSSNTKPKIVATTPTTVASPVVAPPIAPPATPSNGIGKEDLSKSNIAKEQPAPIGLDLAKGRVPFDQFVEHMKREQKLEIHSRSDAAGTSFDFFNKILREPCRIHIGGRENLGQNVSAILVESIQDKQLAAILVATPMDLSRSPTRGNNLGSLVHFVRSMLPGAEIRKIFGEQSMKIALGDDVKDVLGKVKMALRYDKAGKEFRLMITIDR